MLPSSLYTFSGACSAIFYGILLGIAPKSLKRGPVSHEVELK